MQCTDVIRMDPSLALGVVIMISTYPTTLETTRTPSLDAVVRTRNPQDTQLVTVVFLQGGIISLQRTSKYSMKQVIKKNIPFQGQILCRACRKIKSRIVEIFSGSCVARLRKAYFFVILRACVGL